jgi:glutamyl aminopeptidase
LINRANNKNTIDTSDSKFNKKYNMSIAKIVDKLTFRLPRQISPVAYNLLLHPDLKNQTFKGSVKIDFVVSDPINFVALHSKLLEVKTKSLIKKLDNGAEGIGIKNSFEFEKFEYFIVEPDVTLTVGNYTIDLDFNGRLDGSIVGFYGSSYFDKTKNERR